MNNVFTSFYIEIFAYQKPLVQALNASFFLLKNNLCGFQNKFRRLFCTQKPGLNFGFKDLVCENSLNKH